jgi:hypothetical protein
VKACNYVPPQMETDYADAILSEFKKIDADGEI